MSVPRSEAVRGCLLGTAVGDAVGLCCEGLSPRRQRRLFPDLDGPRLLGRRGMVSDDTEHACMTAQALIVSGGEPARFVRSLAWRLRFWLLGLPAGVGFATLRSILKLWLGFPPRSSGVFSAGNGPCMRSGLLGVCHGQDLPRLRELVRASTRLTHTDPRAEAGALAVALAAHTAAGADLDGAWPGRFRDALGQLLPPGAEALQERVGLAVASAASGQSTAEFAAALGLGRGVTGFVNHTVPVVLHAWFRHPEDYRQAVLATVRCGGDTDTTASIVGGIVGARVGKAGIPAGWLAALWEWPRTVGWMERLAERLTAVCAAGGAGQRPLPLSKGGLLLRNLVFLLVVLGHGFRRLLPPY
jgi:ADP-ribosyl-[dinitrogen reductase] hydrolase